MAVSDPPNALEGKTASQQAADGAVDGMAGVGAGGEEYSPWCPTTWVDTGVSSTVSEHVVGATHNNGWVESSVPELPSLADLDWMSSLTDSASSADEDNSVREIPSSPPLEPPKSPPNDMVSKLEVRRLNAWRDALPRDSVVSITYICHSQRLSCGLRAPDAAADRPCARSRHHGRLHAVD